ncbi:hypothetical protein PHSY_004012 [Pseudozyma hubeiensis SY62]|uniref:Uncharacterized protein n=1 Tax=Pseudozyma hubeiensis (strain SY62) TaxID=1305764 RepID=R9P5D3_PSEHS|nr:hypothetical protein PHSY_004012 [Pseudozyma hubeiensis SY62]GAC96432.1 hypothetical protein PHSY_004012 [Pseudozyma hubeiensis SY62]
MAAATLPLSRSVRVPLANRQNTNEFDDWGPSSIPPTVQSNVPWDEQVVPALRKKLQAESNNLSKRISRIQDSDEGWARSRQSIDHRDPRAAASDRRISREVVHHHRESSIDQFHNRFASMRAPSRQQSGDVVSSSFPFQIADSQDSKTERGSALSHDATARAREKARQIAASRSNATQRLNGGSSATNASSTDTDGGVTKEGMDSTVDAIPEGKVAGDAVQSSSASERKRLRTQSTPMRPSLDAIDPAYSATSRRSPNQPSHDSQQYHPSRDITAKPGNSHQRSNSLSRRKAAMDPKLMEEFGPLGATPSPTAKLLRAHEEFHPASPATPSSSLRSRNVQPDAFRSLSKIDQVRYREVSAPPAFGQDGDSTMSEFGASPGSKSVNSWEDQIIPTVARKLQQEQFLRAGMEGQLGRYEGLIDTWDKNGLPLSRSDVIAMQKANKQNGLPQEQQAGNDLGDEQMLIPGPALQHKNSNLSPAQAGFSERSRSRASSRRSQQSGRSQQQSIQASQAQPEPQAQKDHLQQNHAQRSQQEFVPMQTFESHAPSTTAQPSQASAPAPLAQGKQGARDDDKVDKGGCCCIVM